jgi:transcriptional regulator with XRE-family HTH domain
VCRARGITQAEIAAAVGASQGQVSRILRGHSHRSSRLHEEVCLYVERFASGVTAGAVRDNDELIEAIKSTWDGSASHARALSAVIRSLAVLRMPNAISAPKTEGVE